MKTIALVLVLFVMCISPCFGLPGRMAIVEVDSGVVKVMNLGDIYIDMEGYTLSDKNSQLYTFPDGIVNGGDSWTVMIPGVIAKDKIILWEPTGNTIDIWRRFSL